MSDKKCSHHKNKRWKIIRLCFAGILIVLFILLVIFLVTWAILQPKKPRFVLQDATVFAFNVSAPNFLTSNFQVTITSRNPNDKIGIYYDKLDAFAMYQSQQITYYTTLPSGYQGHKDVTTWSPFVYGTDVPVAPYNGISLSQDQADGAVRLNIKIDGRIRWKVGTIITGTYHLHVTCPAYISFGQPNAGIVVGNAIKYTLSVGCSVGL